MTQFTDKEFLEELKKRIRLSKEAREEQNFLLNELEKVNEKLVTSEKVKSRFISNVKNEIKNPLTSVLGLTRMLINGDVEEEKLQTSLKNIHHDVFKLNFDLDNIFMAAELEAGNIEIELTNGNVKENIETIARNYIEVFGQKCQQIPIKFAGPHEFHTDHTKLNLVLSNLISNAVKFSHKSCQVEINASISENNELHIEVKDFGIGINPENSKKIFNRFSQIDSSSTKPFSGQGMGLAVSSNLVDLLEGKMTFESQENVGSNFYVWLPSLKNHLQDEELFDDEDEFLFSNSDELF